MNDRPYLPDWILDHYRVVERLGGGIWSDVYKVATRGTGSLMAVKVLKQDFHEDPRIRSRFLTEARAMARLVHPNIIRIFDVGGAMGQEPAIVMEYCEKGDLREYATDIGMPAGDAAYFMLYMLLGLVEAHKVGCIHRGLCPESVFLDEELQPKLGDFGVAKLEQNPHLPTRPAESLGEFLYSAPEQRYDARRVDQRADLYAMGAMLWFMLQGQDPPDLSLASRSPEVLDGIHPRLARIIAKACEVRPEDRFQSAAAMGRAIRALF